MATPTRSQDIKKSSVGSVTPIEGNRTEVPTEPIAMSSAEFTPPWITNPITRLVRDKYGNWITRPASDRYGHIIQGADSTWSFQQGGQMPQGADKEQGGTINKFQRGSKIVGEKKPSWFGQLKEKYSNFITGTQTPSNARDQEDFSNLMNLQFRESQKQQ